jgi:hypothetical protein
MDHFSFLVNDLSFRHVCIGFKGEQGGCLCDRWCRIANEGRNTVTGRPALYTLSSLPHAYNVIVLLKTACPLSELHGMSWGSNAHRFL